MTILLSTPIKTYETVESTCQILYTGNAQSEDVFNKAVKQVGRCVIVGFNKHEPSNPNKWVTKDADAFINVKIHFLKTWQPHYSAVSDNWDKTAELRLNDRDFCVGDYLVLEEFCEDKGYSGEFSVHEITWITPSEDSCGALNDGFVMLSLN
jgi:hypothetical protein